jgi:glycosyltransferase involved in cell wall biosynthesis
MTWDAYDPVSYDGLRLGMKSDSFGPYLDLPRRIGAPLELAVGSPSAPRAELARRGWRVRNPLAEADDPWAYQAFIARSRAELSVAKQGYVAARTGWFSERSACYLASGRPVLVQDTGFSEVLPAGEGIVAFSSPDEAVRGAADIARRYERHCRAARRVAEEHFDARTVLGRLLAAVAR